MRTRILGIALVALAGLAGLTLASNLVSHFSGPDRHASEVRLHRTAKDARPTLAAGERVMLDQVFDVAPGELLTMDVQHADVEIETGSGTTARLTVTIESRDMEKAVARYEAMRFESGHSTDGVWLRSQPQTGNAFRDWWGNVRMSIKVHAVIPEQFDLDLTSTHGDVLLDDLKGDAAIRTTHGDLTVASVFGDRVDLDTTHGDVAASSIAAPFVEIRTTHGDLAFGQVSSARFKATTTHSDVVVSSLSGMAELSTTHGDVMVDVSSLEGLEIRTTHGDVAVELPTSAGADLDLKGAPVRLTSDAAFAGERSKDRVRGTLHGGGARVDVQTTFGSVHIGS